MVSTLELNKTQELALNKQLSVVNSSKNGSIIKAALHNGFLANFQGCYLSEVVTATPGQTYSRTGIDFDLNPYRIHGVKQRMTLRGSDATAVAAAGFPNAAASGDVGVLRLTNRVANGANAVAMCQDNALWIAPSTNFSVNFDVKQWATRTHGKNIAFTEMGVVGTCVVTDVYNSALPLGYVNGSIDNTSIMFQLSSSKGRLRYKPNALALPTAEVTADFEVPAGAFSLRMEYSSGSGILNSPSLAVFVNDVPAALNSGRFGFAVVGDLTFTEVVIGVRPTLYTIAFIAQAPGPVTIGITANVIHVHMDPTAVTGSTAAMIKAAWGASAAAMAIATCVIAAGQDAVVQIAIAAVTVTGGANASSPAVYSIPITIAGPLQIAARACQGVDYVAATHTVAPIVDIDSIFVTIG